MLQVMGQFDRIFVAYPRLVNNGLHGQKGAENDHRRTDRPAGRRDRTHGKDLSELLETLAKAKRADGGRGVDLISTAEALDTSTAIGELISNILGAISQWERKIIAERTSAALQKKREQGRSTGGIPPYGYEFVDGERVENPEKQAVLADIQTMKAAGHSWQKITDALTEDGHTTRRGGPLTWQGIFRIAKKNGIA